MNLQREFAAARFSLLLGMLFLLPLKAMAETPLTGPIQISIDARSLDRHLVEAELRLPLQPAAEGRQIALWYPKWVPGSHGPGGPVANIAGLQFHDAAGQRLNWKRTGGEVYRLTVDVPAGCTEIRVDLRYVSDQPTTTSFGHDCFGSEHIGVISPGCLLLYPEGANIDQQQITLQMNVPDVWTIATALPRSDDSAAGFLPATLRRFVDSPIMIGRYYQSFDLVEHPQICPPHTLHVFADSEAETDLNKDVVQKYRQMVTQTALLIGSHPFDRFDIILGVTGSLPKNGLEHARSTFNVLPPGSLRSTASLKGWDRLLVPHEYLHAWCGKYRRPAGMLTSDFHTAKDTELLWVYEGLTQYLGELVEARSGLMSEDEFRQRLFVELRAAMNQEGRQWRTLADTAAASHILRSSSPFWSELRRSQDYYMEGMLFWLEADARIRQLSGGAKTLDDFCHSFFRGTADVTVPSAYGRNDVITHLNEIAEYQWDSLITRRVESLQQEFDPRFVDLLGYRLQPGEKPQSIPGNTFRQSGGIDVLDSLGMVLSGDGRVQRVRLGGLADSVGLRRGTEIIGVGEYRWSEKRFLEAVQKSSETKSVDLLIAQGERLVTLQLPFDRGLQYWNLVREESEVDVLSQILKSLEP